MPTAYPDNPYGVTLRMNNLIPIKLSATVVNQVKALGCSWVRIILNWSLIEKSSSLGTYKWNIASGGPGLDESIQLCNASGLNVEFCITGPPDARLTQHWGGNVYYAPATDMHDFAVQVATRYQTGSSYGVISAIEPGNEDYNGNNDTYHHGWWEAQAFNLVYPAVKNIDPNMLVIMGGQLQTGINFVPTFQQELYDGNPGLSIAGIGANMDASNSHYYRGNLQDPTKINKGTFSIADKLAIMHKIDGDNGYGNRDFWVTEFGWAASKNGSSKLCTFAQQSQWDMDVVDAARTSGFCSHAFPYTIDYSDANSMVGPGNVLRPSYTAYQAYIAAHPPSTWPGFSGGGSGGGSAYKSMILSDNPQAYYRLDEQVGLTAQDSSSRNYTATYASSGVTYAEPGLISGDSDTAVLLDGISGQVTCTNGPYTKGWTAITLEGWVELSNITFATGAPLWANGIPSNDNSSVNLSIGAGGANLIFSVGNGTTYATLTATYSFLASTRYYIAATWDGTTMKVWINPTSSTPTATQAFSGASLGTPPQVLCIGGNLANGNNFPGTMDECATYKNVALSGARILAHYTAGTTGVASAPTFTLSPTALNPQAPGVTKVGATYTATVSLGETSGSIGNATWTAASSLSGVTFTPSSGTLTPGGTPTLITISGIPALNGTFTFSGGESETPVVTTWTVAQQSQAGGFALFANGAGVASFDHYRVTGYPDPALSLAGIGRAGASVANWNANLPNTNTTLAMNTSLDGVNWTPVAAAGSPISGITTQPSATGDTFNVDSSANYTQTFETGGSVSTWTWDTTNSRLVATGGQNGLLINTGLTGVGDLILFADMDYADSAALVWHYQDSGDFYALLVHDASNPGSNPNTMSLLKVVSGTISTLVTNTAISFNRNTYHRIQVSMLAGVISATFDGTQILSYTDGSPLAAGQIGLRNSAAGGASTARYYQIYVQPQGQLLSGMDNYVYSQLVLGSSDPLNSPQVLDSATMVSDPTLGLGALIPGVAYQRTFCSANFNDLKKQSDYFCYVTDQKQVIFNQRTAFPAPWIVQATDSTNSNLLVAGLGVEYSGDLYRNREVLQNVQATQTFVKQFAGDGTSTTWTLDYPVAVGTVPQIAVSSSSTVPQSIGVKGVDTGKAYYYTPGATGISQDASQSVLTGLQTLIVTYQGAFTTDVVVDNAVTGDYPGTTAQDAYALLQPGTSGIVEDVLDISQSDLTKNMDVDTATQYGQSLLQAYGVVGRTVTFRTQKAGLAIGQQLPVFISQYEVINMQGLIIQVDITAQNGGSDGGPLYWYAVTAVEGPVMADAVKLIGTVFG